MKKQTSITALLGLRQQDVAMLLQVHPSQWSMYESGKRDLPLPAKQLLAELLTHIQAPETTAKSHPIEGQQAMAQQQLLERLLRENEYQQLLIAKKIKVVTKKVEDKIKVLKLVDYMVQRPANKRIFETLHLKEMEYKATKSIETDGSAVLLQHQIKQELLVLEKLTIESKLRKILLSIESKEG